MRVCGLSFVKLLDENVSCGRADVLDQSYEVTGLNVGYCSAYLAIKLVHVQRPTFTV